MAIPLNCLFVEDSPDDVELLLRELRRAGYDVKWTRVQAEADYLRALETPPELVISDYSMPKFNGLKAVELLRQRGLDIPFILVSGTVGEEIAVEAMRRGATDYLFKDRLARFGQSVNQALSQAYHRRERKKTEDALRKSENHLRAILESSPECVKLLAEDGTLLEMNPAGLRMIEADDACQVVGQNIISLVLPEYRAAFTRLTEQVFAGYSATLEFEISGLKGTRRWLETHATPLREGDDKIVAALGLTRDITGRKQAELALKESLVRFQAVWENAIDALRLTDQNGVIVAVNSAYCHLVGMPAVELVGQPFTVAYEAPHPAEAMLQRYRARFEARSFAKREQRRLTLRKSRQVDLDISTNIIEVGGGKPLLLSLFRDVTEWNKAKEARKRLEAQLQQSQKMEAFGQLAGGVAHDFNNLLSVISGYAEFLASGTATEAESRDSLSEIRKAADRAAALTRQLLAFSRKQVMEPRVLDLNSLVADAEKMLRRLISEDIRLNTILREGVRRVKVDPGQMDQVIMNLTVNARDAVPRGGQITIETSNVELDESYTLKNLEVVPGRYVLLAVSDTGCGMTREVAQRVFEPFFTTKEAGKGTGLGLAVVHGIVQQSGGHIAVYSEPNVGTTFKIYLPAVTDSASRKASTSVDGAVRGTETILLAEDEDAVRLLTVKVLQRYGYKILAAADASEALRISDSHRDAIHLLMTDVVMPGMSGNELATTLRAKYPKLKVLFQSGYTDDAIVRHGILESGVAFIQKPFTPSALARKVRDVLDQRSQ